MVQRIVVHNIAARPIECIVAALDSRHSSCAFSAVAASAVTLSAPALQASPVAASITAAAGIGCPQHSHIGCSIGSNDAKHESQIGMRLAFCSVVPQIRQGRKQHCGKRVNGCSQYHNAFSKREGYDERYSTTAG